MKIYFFLAISEAMKDCRSVKNNPPEENLMNAPSARQLSYFFLYVLPEANWILNGTKSHPEKNRNQVTPHPHPYIRIFLDVGLRSPNKYL